jgi:hypothetical protein
MFQKTGIRRFVRCVARVAPWLCLGLIAACVWFNVFLYPTYGLTGFGREQYQEALRRTAAGFAESESLTLVSILEARSLTESSDSGKRALAWGTVMFLTSRGGEVFGWVALKWSPLWNRWERRECDWLADPADRLLFAENLLGLGNFNRTRYALANLYREELRRLRELWLR